MVHLLNARVNEQWGHGYSFSLNIISGLCYLQVNERIFFFAFYNFDLPLH